MAGPNHFEEISPLDQIRQAEAESTRRIAAAREAAEKTLAQARAQAEQIKRQARAAGQQEGKARVQLILSRAEEEAKVIELEAGRVTETMHQLGEARMDAMIDEAIDFLLGLEGGPTD